MPYVNYSKKSSYRKSSKAPTKRAPKNTSSRAYARPYGYRTSLPRRVENYTTIQRSLITGSNDASYVGLDAKSGFALGSGTATGGTSWNMQFNFMLSAMNMQIGGLGVDIQAVPSFSEIQNMYDNYRIKYIEFKIIFSNNLSNVNTPSTYLPTLLIVKDYDDSNNTDYNALLQYDNCISWQPSATSTSKTIFIKPRVANLIYQTNLTSGYSQNDPKAWLDTSYPAIPH